MWRLLPRPRAALTDQEQSERAAQAPQPGARRKQAAPRRRARPQEPRRADGPAQRRPYPRRPLRAERRGRPGRRAAPRGQDGGGAGPIVARQHRALTMAAAAAPAAKEQRKKVRPAANHKAAQGSLSRGGAALRGVLPRAGCGRGEKGWLLCAC